MLDVTFAWLNPLWGAQYQFWSGYGANFSPNPYWGLAIFLWWRHHNCVEPGCWRRGHPDPVHGHPICRGHSEHFAETHGPSA